MPAVLQKLLIRPTQSVRDAIQAIDGGAVGIALVVDEQSQLLGTVTDGDVRRAILVNVSLDEPVSRIMQRHPTTLPLGASHEEILGVMKAKEVKHIPLLDPWQKVCDIALLQDLVAEPAEIPNSVILMAGGAGTRLRPLTDSVPKPLLPVGNRPLLEIMVEHLARQGFRNFLISVNYLGGMIEKHFDDGSRLGVRISYIRESEPLGTAGSLGLARKAAGFHSPALVINGDLLTKINFRDFLEFHRQCGNDLTLGISDYDLRLPYGVVDRNSLAVERIQEKPVYQFSIFAGMGALEDKVLDLIPEGERMDMTLLANTAIDRGLKVGSFPIREYWLDVGRLDDFRRASQDFQDDDGS